MNRVAIICLMIAGLVSAGGASPQKPKKPKPTAAATAKPATPRQENQFVTVEEFVHARRPPKTAVSIEGYIVLGFELADGSERLMVVDSVDHVLSANDANAFARTGATGILPAASIKKRPTWTWTKGIQRLSMYTGPGTARKGLHDTVPKVRVTGWTAYGAVVSPVTKIEYQNENGDWRIL